MKFLFYCLTFITLIHALLVYTKSNAAPKPLESAFSKELVLKQTTLGITIENTKATYALFNNKFGLEMPSHFKLICHGENHFLIASNNEQKQVAIPLIASNNNYYIH